MVILSYFFNILLIHSGYLLLLIICICWVTKIIHPIWFWKGWAWYIWLFTTIKWKNLRNPRNYSLLNVRDISRKLTSTSKCIFFLWSHIALDQRKNIHFELELNLLEKSLTFNKIHFSFLTAFLYVIWYSGNRNWKFLINRSVFIAQCYLKAYN